MGAFSAVAQDLLIIVLISAGILATVFVKD